MKPVSFPRNLPALDGVRALAVLAVLAYHGGLGVAPGGFLGVDAFFALSGFLITSLHLDEWSRRSKIQLAAFWGRRARRLLPALLLLLLVLGAARSLLPGSYSDLRADALSTLFYVGNWHLIASGSNYFAQSWATSPLTHTWSLAIEEQFYLVWPLVLVVVLKRRGTRTLLAVCLAGALASALEMMLLYRSGAGSSRLYYGTDTHAQSLLVGAALAVVLCDWAQRRGSWEMSSGAARRALTVLGVAGAVVTLLLWHQASGSGPFVFEGGFLLAAIATAFVLIPAVTIAASPLTRALSVRPLRALGRISYGVYLWHLPLFLVITGSRTGLTGYPLFAIRLACTLLFAIASFRLIEKPIRHGELLRSWRGWIAAPASVAVVGAVVMLANFGPAATVPASASMPASSSITTGSSGQSTTTSLSEEPTPTRASSSESAATAGVDASVRPGHLTRVLVVGDSLAGTLAAGLGIVAPRYGVELVNEGSPGCSVSMDVEFEFSGFDAPPGPPCQVGKPDALLQTWARWVDEFNPDVVVYLARGETFDQQMDGQWTDVGDPAFASWVDERLREAVTVLSSRGAHVLLLTSPYYDTGEQPSGAPFPEDDPSRADRVNALIRSVARDSRGVASVFDLGGMVSPGGSFQSVVDGVKVRCADGAHFTEAAGEWLAPKLFPQILELGAVHQRLSQTGPPPLPPQAPVVPTWMAKLSCGVS